MTAGLLLLLLYLIPLISLQVFIYVRKLKLSGNERYELSVISCIPLVNFLVGVAVIGIGLDMLLSKLFKNK